MLRAGRPMRALRLAAAGARMTADTTTTVVVDQCVTCHKSTAEPPRRVERQAFVADDGTTRWLYRYCWMASPLENLRGRRWLPAPSTNAPPPPPRQAPSRRRTDVVVEGACCMCGRG